MFFRTKCPSEDGRDYTLASFVSDPTPANTISWCHRPTGILVETHIHLSVFWGSMYKVVFLGPGVSFHCPPGARLPIIYYRAIAQAWCSLLQGDMVEVKASPSLRTASISTFTFASASSHPVQRIVQNDCKKGSYNAPNASNWQVCIKTLLRGLMILTVYKTMAKFRNYSVISFSFFCRNFSEILPSWYWHKDNMHQ